MWSRQSAQEALPPCSSSLEPGRLEAKVWTRKARVAPVRRRPGQARPQPGGALCGQEGPECRVNLHLEGLIDHAVQRGYIF